MKFTKPNNGRASRSGKPNGGNGKTSMSGKKPLRAVRALKQPDNSVLRPPIETSVAGLRQAVRLFETSTPEVVHLMSFECDIIYECRVCKNLFRSVANFISHKRVYCTRRFNHVQNSQVVEDHTLLVEGNMADEHLQMPTRITARQDLTTIVQQASMAQYYRDAEDKLSQRDLSRSDTMVHLQPIENTSYGVYQTFGTNGSSSLMKDQVSELQNIMRMKEGVTLGPDGKILQNVDRLLLESPKTPEKAHAAQKDSTSPKSEEHLLSNHEHICALCKAKFSSKKTLSHHTRNAHNSFRVAYTCPCCINLFTNTWSVLRHLAKVHRKTNDQVRRLRTQIQKKQVHAEKLMKKTGDSKNSSPSSSSSNTNSNKRAADAGDNLEWIEVVKKGTNEILRCAGCRRQFERQAAFQSHTQICHKRMALCNKGSTAVSVQLKAEKNKLAAVGMKAQTQSEKPLGGSEKRIGIQVRMNYCKSAASPSSSPATSSKNRRSDRHKNEAVNRTSLLLPHDVNDKLDTSHSNHNSKDRCSPNSIESVVDKRPSVVDSDTKSSSSASDKVRSKIIPKQKTRKIESISRLLMQAVGTREESLNSGPVITVNGDSHGGSKECDDNTTVPKKDAGDISSRASASGSSDDNSKCDSKVDSGNVKSGKQTSRTRVLSRLSVDTVMSSKENDNEDLKDSVSPVDCNSIVNGIHPVSPPRPASGDGSDRTLSLSVKVEGTCEEDSRLSPSKEGVIRVLTRYQLKSICKKDPGMKKEEEEELVGEEEVVEEEPEEVLLDRLREMFKNYIHYKTLQCLVCHEKMKNIVDLKNHVADHFDCNQFRCMFAQCSFVTFARSECLRHLTRTHLKQSERHLAPGYIGRVDGNSTSGDSSESTSGLDKGSARRKKAIPLKKDVFLKGATPVTKQEPVAEIDAESETATAEFNGASSQLKMKSSSKRRKVIGADALPHRKCSPDSTTTPEHNDQARFQSEKGEMMVLSESEEEVTQHNTTGEKSSWRESLRSFRGFADCTKEEVALMESRRSVGDVNLSSVYEEARTRTLGMPPKPDNDVDWSIRTMVMNVIFGPDQVTATNSSK